MSLSPEPRNITRRPQSPDDETFLHSLLLHRTAAELSLDHLPVALKEQILGMQARLRLQSAHANYPNGLSEIILIDSQPAGWLYTHHTADALRLVDITLHSDVRGHGLGSSILQELISTAARLAKPLRLSVDVRNAGAIRLYQRLGFQRTAGDEVQHQMEHVTPMPARPPQS